MKEAEVLCINNQLCYRMFLVKNDGMNLREADLQVTLPTTHTEDLVVI
jgi:hypothetical protein